MKIVEWFRKIMKMEEQKLLSENNMQHTNENDFKERKRGFFSSLHRNVGNKVIENREREEVLRNLVEDLRVEDSFPYNITYDEYEFMEKIKLKDAKGVLTEGDKKALFCIKGAICDGNDLLGTPKKLIEKAVGALKSDKNVIDEFLKEFPNNIIVLIDLMKKYARRSQKELSSDYIDYIDITKLIENYKGREVGIE